MPGFEAADMPGFETADMPGSEAVQALRSEAGKLPGKTRMTPLQDTMSA